ncbi:MAG: hypothetical protein JW791_00965 [Nanoarchaeota archaeon]|nr:hypothetical protein [Nanoarchaeota archaeon]
MAADALGFLAVVAMGIFTVFAILGGYLLLNTAVTNLAKESAYYSYLRITEVITDSMQNTYSTAAKLQFNPTYVVFSAYFKDDSQIPYYVFEGQRFNNVAVNLDDTDFFEQIISSSTGQSSFNQGVANREELRKCVGDACVCISEMTTFLLVEPEYFIPNACVEICWGENPADYDNCLNNMDNDANYPSSGAPREIMKFCNDKLNTADNPACQNCVTYMNDYANKLELVSGDGYNILRIKTGSGNNGVTSDKLNDFSKAHKFSFVGNVIECRAMGDLARSAGKNPYCKNKPYNFNVTLDNSAGIFSILTTSKLENSEILNYNTIMELLNMQYYQNDVLTPDTCYTSITNIASIMTEANI